MQPRDLQVIQLLSQVLKNELTAINQDFLHAKMFEDWDLPELAKHERSESFDEMNHAGALIDRILSLGGSRREFALDLVERAALRQASASVVLADRAPSNMLSNPGRVFDPRLRATA